MDTAFVGHHISSGGFIFYMDAAATEPLVLLIKNKKGEFWVPKGHIEENENDVDAAFREIEEEVGLKRAQLRHLGLCHLHTYSFVNEARQPCTKEVYLHVFHALEKPEVSVERTSEIVDGEWTPYTEALHKIIPFSRNELIRAKAIFDERPQY